MNEDGQIWGIFWRLLVVNQTHTTFPIIYTHPWRKPARPPRKCIFLRVISEIFLHIFCPNIPQKRRTESISCPEQSRTVRMVHTWMEPAKQVESWIYFWSILSCRKLWSNLKLVVASDYLSWCYFRSKTSWRPRWCSFPIRPGQTFLVPVKVRQVRSWKKIKTKSTRVVYWRNWKKDPTQISTGDRHFSLTDKLPAFINEIILYT